MGNQFLYVLVVGTKRKPSVPGEKVTAQKTTTTTTEFVDGRRLKKGCSLCKGKTAGIPGDKHSRTTCTKLLVHGVNSSLKLHNLINLGARSILSVPHRLDFEHSNLEENIPHIWVHVVIQDFFAAPVGLGSEHIIVFKVAGLDNIGDLILGKEVFVLLPALVRKFERCMTSYQAKRIMILSHKAGRLGSDSQSNNAHTPEQQCTVEI